MHSYCTSCKERTTGIIAPPKEGDSGDSADQGSKPDDGVRCIDMASHPTGYCCGSRVLSYNARLPLTPHAILLPVRSQDSLHILRPLIDGLIPGHAVVLLAERCHRLDELIHLRV